jgi:hypothetical protein
MLVSQSGSHQELVSILFIEATKLKERYDPVESQSPPVVRAILNEIAVACTLYRPLPVCGLRVGTGRRHRK